MFHILLVDYIYKEMGFIMKVLPTVFERVMNVDRMSDIYSYLLKDRIILCTGEIDDELSSLIIAQFLYLNSLNQEDILFYIHSPGGNIPAGLAIYDVMQFVSCDVSTIGIGICASMASILLCAGTPKKRFITQNCEVMIHQPMGMMKGQASDMKIAADRILKVQERLYELIHKHTHKSIEIIRKDCDRDTYFDAYEAIEYGLVDEII